MYVGMDSYVLLFFPYLAQGCLCGRFFRIQSGNQNRPENRPVPLNQFLVGGLEHFIFSHIFALYNHPNWLIFFRGVETTNQICSGFQPTLAWQSGPGRLTAKPCNDSLTSVVFVAIFRGDRLNPRPETIMVWDWRHMDFAILLLARY